MKQNGIGFFLKAQRYILMTEQERRARLNEIGKEIARMYPDVKGSITFNIHEGTYKGIKEENNLPATN